MDQRDIDAASLGHGEADAHDLGFVRVKRGPVLESVWHDRRSVWHHRRGFDVESKAMEKRLYAYPVILLKIKDDEETLNELRTYGVHERSKSSVRFMKNGVRLTPEEIKSAVIQDLTAKIAGDRKEAETIKKALTIIESDPYRDIVKRSPKRIPLVVFQTAHTGN